MLSSPSVSSRNASSILTRVASAACWARRGSTSSRHAPIDAGSSLNLMSTSSPARVAALVTHSRASAIALALSLAKLARPAP